MAKKTNYIKNGKEYYRISKVVGHKSDGTPVRKEFYGESRKDAENKAIKYMSDLQNGLIFDSRKALLAESMHFWLFNVKKHDNIKPTTFESYEATFRIYIKDNLIIANKPVSEISSRIIQSYYTDLNLNNISSKKIRKIHKLLYQFFKYAILEGLTLRNPLDNVTIPKLESEYDTKEELQYYSESEVKEIIEKIKGYDIELIVLMALGTGLRQGELLALTYDDIDFENKQVHVRRTAKTYAVFDNEGKKYVHQNLSDTKTKNSTRFVDIPDSLLEKIPRNKTGFIFTENEKIYEARKIYRHWISFLKENDLPIKPFHSLRHTYATMLLSKGVELIVVSKLLGHSSVQITQIYADVIPKLKNDAASKLNSLF